MNVVDCIWTEVIGRSWIYLDINHRGESPKISQIPIFKIALLLSHLDRQINSDAIRMIIKTVWIQCPESLFVVSQNRNHKNLMYFKTKINGRHHTYFSKKRKKKSAANERAEIVNFLVSFLIFLLYVPSMCHFSFNEFVRKRREAISEKCENNSARAYLAWYHTVVLCIIKKYIYLYIYLYISWKFFDGGKN